MGRIDMLEPSGSSKSRRGRPLVAVTGATGFLGRHLVAALGARGFRMRILARRHPSPLLWPDLAPEIVPGDLDDMPALGRLVHDADIVIHAAGLIRARSRREFLAVNRDGAARLAAATQRQAPRAHLIAISSLAARAPQLSAYAESKHAGEGALVAGFAGRLTILRPPVIYGPLDRETLGIFRAAGGLIVPVPGPARARIAMIHVADAAAAVAAVAAWSEAPKNAVGDGIHGAIHALADSNPQGYAPRDIMALAAAVVGNRRPRFIRVPAPAVRLAGQAASLLAWLRGRPGVFSAGKARELVYGDWGVAPWELLPATVSPPGIDLPHGFVSTVAWYRQAGWLA